jgi:hypothetical protein
MIAQDGQLIPQLPREAGIVQTVALMRSLAVQGAAHPTVRRQAESFLRTVSGFPHWMQIDALGEWVRARTRYQRDADELEELSSPITFAETIEAGGVPAGDCDDLSTYLAALAKALGWSVYYRVAGRNNAFHHVYAVIDGRRVDVSVPISRPPFVENRVMMVRV